jgi:RNA polymerase sigma factor (sigma-70 family)
MTAQAQHINEHDTVVATDGELLVRFARHADHRAFVQLVERHGGLVWIVCREMLRHHQDVEDAFQATFLILAERASSIRSSDSAAAWLHRVAQRTALAARRKRARRREEELVEETVDPDPGPAAISHRELIYVLLEELRKLPDRYQVPLVLRYFERLSRRTIAEHTDSTVAQIQGRLVRGRRMLRSRMLRRGVSLSLATGAMADVSTEAETAITPAIASATAKRCLARKTSGDTTGITPAALWLAQQGAKAMGIASMLKMAAAVSTLLIMAGIGWGVEAGSDGNGKSPAAPAATKANLQIAATSAASGSGKPSDDPKEAAQMQQEQTARERDYQRELRRRAGDLMDVIAQRIRDKAKLTAALEMQQLDKKLLERQIEKQSDNLTDLQSPASADDTKLLPDKRTEKYREIDEEFTNAKKKLETLTDQTAQLSAEIERVQLLINEPQQRIEELQRVISQLEVRQVIPPTAVPSSPPASATYGIEPTGNVQDSKTEMLSLAIAPAPNAEKATGKIEPRDALRIRVANAFADQPIDGVYLVESMGTVALGPVYGRVDVKGLTLLEAEKAVKKHLAEVIQDPQVQVTLSEKRSSVQEMEQLRQQIDGLRAENATLSKQLKQDRTRGVSKEP